MREARAAIKFTAFFAMTIGISLLWYAGAPVVRFLKLSEKKWREFIFANWSGAFVSIANAKLKIVGVPPRAPFLLVSNHLGYFDIAAYRSVLKCVFVAKADVAGWFGIGKVIGGVGTIFINRENRRDIPRAGAEIIRAINRGEAVVIFPEGTSSDGSVVLPFKSSFLEFAAAGGLPVYYAAVSYRTPHGEAPAREAVCWWRPETDFASHVFQLFKLSSFTGTITFGSEPVRSNDRKELAQKLHQAVAETFEPVN